MLQQMRENMLRQTLHVCVANMKFQSVDTSINIMLGHVFLNIHNHFTNERMYKHVQLHYPTNITTCT